MNANDTLKIRLTEDPPYWAEAGIIALQQLPQVEIFEAHSPVDESLIDVVLHFGSDADAVHQQYGAGRLGFWFFRFGGQDLDINTATRRAAAANVALETSLWARFADDRYVCIYQSFGQLDAFATWRSVARAIAKAAYFPARAIVRYQRGGELVSYTAEAIASGDSDFISYLVEAKAVLTKVLSKLFYHEQWFIVVGKSTELLPDPTQHHWQLIPPANCFWADPFVLEQDGRVWALLEVLPFATDYGYLAAVELFADGSHSDAHTMMNTGSHLSYPFIFNWQGELYMLPEAGASRELTLWHCEQFPDRWTKAATLLSDICYTDATLCEHDGRWWLFLTIGSEDGICLQDELHLYYADSPLGVWTAHANNPVKSDARSARPAGNMFTQDGVLYRPAQDCSTGYGKATVLHRIERLDTDSFSETPIGRIDAGWQHGCLCTHTLSRSDNYWAVDGLRLIPRWSKLFTTQ